MKIARGCIALLLLSAACNGSQDDSRCGGCLSPHPIKVEGGLSVAETGSATLVFPSGDVSLSNGSYVREVEAFMLEDDGDSFALVRTRSTPRSSADAALRDDAAGAGDAAATADAASEPDAADEDAGDAGVDGGADARGDAGRHAGFVPVDPSPRETIMWIESVEGGPHVVLCHDLQEVLSRSAPEEPWVCTNGDVTSLARIEAASVTVTRAAAANGGSTLSLLVSTPSGIRVSVTVVKTYTESHVDPNCY